MKIWKLVSGILCIVFCAMVGFQSCATGLANALEENATDTSAAGGVLLGILMLAGGIVSIATRNGGKGGSIATLVLFLLAALMGFANRGTYADLVIWAAWCLICAIMALIELLTTKKNRNYNYPPQ